MPLKRDISVAQMGKQSLCKFMHFLFYLMVYIHIYIYVVVQLLSPT